ncbi:MAG TPA: lytic transglycosylase domain-containing protein [Gaiellaceae bacterium]|nr:lytic transglycosylase domain-containing protein [Gaiellaceae bacterium]
MSSTLQEVLTRVQELTPQAPAVSTPAVTNPDSTGFSDALDVANGAGATASGSVASTYSAAIDAAGQRYGVDPALLQSVIQQESGFNPYATSAAGAQGLMQLMPSTASSLGVTDPYDPYQSIDAGARYLSSKIDEYGGNTSLALAAYNAGSGAVARYGGIPPYPETQNYVQSVLGRYQQLVNDGSSQ